MKRFIPALAALLGALPAARADVAFPPPPAPISSHKVKLVVVENDGVKGAHLRIPSDLLPAAGKSEKGAEAGVFGLPTIVAGVALTLAFVSGGFWLVRRGRGTARTAAAAVLAASLVALAASAVWADIPRPPRPRGPVELPVALPAGLQLSENLVVDVVGKGEPLTLVVNKGMIRKADKSEDK